MRQIFFRLFATLMLASPAWSVLELPQGWETEKSAVLKASTKELNVWDITSFPPAEDKFYGIERSVDLSKISSENLLTHLKQDHFQPVPQGHISPLAITVHPFIGTVQEEINYAVNKGMSWNVALMPDEKEWAVVSWIPLDKGAQFSGGLNRYGVSLVVPAHIPEESAKDFQAAFLTTLAFLQKKYPSMAYLNGYKGAPLPVNLGAVNGELEVPLEVVEKTEDLLPILQKRLAVQQIPEEEKKQQEPDTTVFSGSLFDPETARLTQMGLNEYPVNPDSSKMAPTRFNKDL
jgi:hypothetical protein